MKRLIALSHDTIEFGIDTKKELNFIEQNNDKLTEDKLVKYYDAKDMAQYGGIYYCHYNETIEFFVVEAFGFVDVDKSSEEQVDYTAIVATKLDEEGKATSNMYYFDFPNTPVKESMGKTITINNHALIRLNANTFESAKQELESQIDFSEVKFA